MKVVFVAGSLEQFEQALQQLPGASTARTRLSQAGNERPFVRASGEEDRTDALMAVAVEYEPSVLTFEQLLDLFWSNHDPQILTGADGNSDGRRHSVVVYYDDEQRIRAIMAKIQLERSGRFLRPIGTQILPAGDLLADDSGPSSQRPARPTPLYGAPPLRSPDRSSESESRRST